MGDVWEFRDCLDLQGRNVVRDGISALPPSQRDEAKAALNNRLLGWQLKEQLGMPEARMLHGECDGLFELRVTLRKANVQLRPLCCFGPGRRQVTILFIAVERGGKFVPLTACSIAQGRRRLVEDKGRTDVHDFG